MADARDRLARLNGLIVDAAFSSDRRSILNAIVSWLAEPEQVEVMAEARWDIDTPITPWQQATQKWPVTTERCRRETRKAIAALAAEPGEVTDG